MVRQRLPALLALALPVLAGAGWLLAAGAPQHFALVNVAALALAAAWIEFGREPETARGRYLLAGALIALMLAPLAVGPAMLSTTGVAVVRWIAIGPVTLHAGMIALPALAVLAARDARMAAPVLLAALLATLVQPDAGTGFAITFAAVGLHHATKDWKVGLAAVLAFFASLRMVVVGELPPQPFVEGVLAQALHPHMLWAVALALALALSFAAITFALPASRAERLTLGGLLFGLIVASMMAPYPTPLIGYGAAPVLGLGLALGLNRKFA
ncbi:MAG: hypothetical protein KDE15_06235 [Erythrobacter sp.]|nr:hypothetical protein [Erythrobacter sp.]